MTDEKGHLERVRLEGWTAGATEKDKSTNPYRGKNNADEAVWDQGWEDGFAGKDYSIWS